MGMAIDLAALDISVDHDNRLALRGDRHVKLTATQVMLLEWLDGCHTPSLEFCCDENWEAVDPEWVRGQIEKLAKALEPLQLTLAIDDDMISLSAAAAPPTEPSSPWNDDEVAARFRRQAEAAGAVMTRVGDLLAVQAEDRARIAELEAEVARLREAAKGQLIVVNQAREEIAARERAEAELGHVRTALAAANDRNAELAGRLEQALKARLKDEREGAVNGGVNAESPEPYRDAPLALAPRHVTIPVSEALYRWLEGVALRNRCSPEHVASRLILAFRQSAIADAKRAA